MAGLALEVSYEKLYEMLLQSIPSSILLVDRRLRVVSANRNFLEKSQRAERDTIGAHVTEIFPDTILAYTRMEEKLRMVFEGVETLGGEQMTYRAPGFLTRVYYYTVAAVKTGTSVQYGMILMDDITEKVRLAEKTRSIQSHLASIVECANDLVISTDPDGRIISWNPSAANVTGYSEEEVKGRRLSDLCETREAMAEIGRRLARGDKVRAQELNLVARSGKLIPVAWSYSAMRDESGRVVGSVIVGRDLSERRAFEMQILQSEKLAALGVMAGGIAHELRNPLAVCFSAAQFLQGEASLMRGQLKECVAKILDNIQRAATIVESLLRFARPSKSHLVERVNLISVVKDAMGLIANQITLDNIKLSEEYRVASVPVMGNASLLQQVVMNLVLNARQAMPEGGEMAISVYRNATHGVLCVRDTGYGIPADMLGKVFDPFFTTQRVGEGTGLGLSVSYAIVQQHQGRIEVESQEGKGSTFTVVLPLAPQNGV